MRPERLSLSAFGPFAGIQVFDFADLGPHRLFLIQGPTGAGKTSLLDALCFALFGESSGSEREAAGLRSQHAAAASVTWVELDFALGPDCYRIRRQPRQPMAGRGGRIVAADPKVTLWRLGPAGAQVLAEQIRQADEQVRQLLGYSADEFRQVVVLPQGRFREILTARPRERTEILSTLFRTGLYRRIQGQIAGLARAALAEATRLQERRATLLRQLAAATPAEAAAALAALAAAAAAASVAAERDAAAAVVAAQALAEGRRDAALLHAAAVAADALAGLRAKAAAVESERTRLQAAQRADRTVLTDELHEQDRRQAERDREAAGRAAQALRQAGERRTQCAAELGDAAARADSLAGLRRRAEALAARAETAERAEAAQQALAQAEAVLGQAQGDAATAQAASAQAGRRRDAAVQAEAEARILAETAESRAKVVAQLRTLQALTPRIATADRDVADRQAAAAAARSRLQTAEAARREAETAVRARHAAWLAGSLMPGMPCPVCGAAEHPAPARHDRDTVPDLEAAVAEEAAARAGQEAAREAEIRAAGERLRLVEQQETLRQTAGAASLDEATCAAAAAAAAVVGLPELGRAVARWRAEGEAQAAALQRAAEAVRQRQTEFDRLRGTLAALAPAAAGGSAALREAARADTASATAEAARLDADRAALAGAEAALQARQAGAAQDAARAEASAARAATRLAAWQEACRAAGFADPAAARAARLPTAAMDALSLMISGFDRDLAQADALARQAADAARGVESPDLPALAAAEAAATSIAREAAEQVVRLQERQSIREALVADATKADAALDRARGRHALLQHAADTANGNNPRRQSLEDFVLASIFDEALACANEHLSRMLSGRYRIRRRDEPVPGGQIGLDIEICDDWTGQVRPAGTLSGGEGFCAALSLALGLSDTVRAHAGARRIDALFIDEGFGSLDPEALETAMEVLGSLQASDRLVGVISHVAELRERIPAQLVVRAGPRGSTAGFAAAYR